MEMMKLMNRLKVFQKEHPKALAFIRDVSQNGIREGSVIEMKVTDPEGKDYVTNIRVTQEDMETVRILRDLQNKE